MLPRRFVTFCKIGSMERQKRITFKKSLSKNIYLSRRYVIFKSKKVWNFPKNPGHILMENQCKLTISKMDLHWFPFGNLLDFWGNFTLLDSWKWHMVSSIYSVAPAGQTSRVLCVFTWGAYAQICLKKAKHNRKRIILFFYKVEKYSKLKKL